MNIINEYRCKECNKLQFKGILIDSKIEIKCKSCKVISIHLGDSINDHLCLKECAYRVKMS